MASWKLATPLAELLAEVNVAYPNRSKKSDGTIGDARHARTNSRHNIHGGDSKYDKYVEAIDITDDPRNGYDAHAHCRRVAQNPPKCIDNIISKGEIWNEEDGWVKYDGENGHWKHVHYDIKNGYENASNYNWRVRPNVIPPPIPAQTIPNANQQLLLEMAFTIAVSKQQILRKGSKGTAVIWLQHGLNALTGSKLTADGDFGASTDQVVRNLQRYFGMPVDGIVGPKTWSLLFK